MSGDNLHDEEAFEPEKLFDLKKFNTIFVDREGFSSPQNAAADLILRLFEPGITRAESEEVFVALKSKKAQDTLVQAIRQSVDESQKKVIAAACWETGLDFTSHFAFFCDIVRTSGFGLAMEAFTVIQEMTGELPQEEISRQLAAIRREQEPANGMVPELKEFLKDKQHRS